MSFTLHGVGVSGGITIGHAHILTSVKLDVVHYLVEPKHLAAEVERFDAAVREVRDELTVLRTHIPAGAPAELPAFLDVHLLILADRMLSEAPRRLIEEQRCNAEWALTQQMDLLVAQFDEIEDDYLRERKADVVQVVERVLKSLMGHPGRTPLPGPEPADCIVVAHELAPTDMVLFKRHAFAGFITDLGGATSHTAILARSMGIPAVMALHHAKALIRDYETIIVDGHEGVVIVAPDEAVLDEYRLRQNAFRLEREKLRRLTTSRSATLDGQDIELLANIELPQDVEGVKESGAAGIGLFRSEFLFMNRDDLPSEDEQFEAYREVARAMNGAPVVIRTLDLGADKHLSGQPPESRNPALGLRAIRLCLAEPALFLPQLKAILRAALFGQVRMLIPMIGSMGELNQTLVLIEQAKYQLTDAGIPFNPAVALGGMIEIPAAALAAAALGRKLDFFSIGTNDLTQYTLAIDRADDSVANLYDALHPAVLGLIAHTLRVARRLKKPVAMCGEMAGDPTLTRMLLAMGLRSFSTHPAHLLAVKQQVLRTSLPDLTGLAVRVLRAQDSDRVRAVLAKANAEDA